MLLCVLPVFRYSCVALFSLSLLALCSLLPLGSMGCAYAEENAPFSMRFFSVAKPIQRDMIRVGLSDDAMIEQAYPSTVISSAGEFTLATSELGANAQRITANTKLLFSAKNGQLAVTATKPGAPATVVSVPFSTSLWVLPGNSETPLKVLSTTRKGNTPHYRGTFEIRIAHHTGSKLMVVNHLPMSDYLRAVVPNELPIRFGREAVRAQSVAARNYALRPRETSWPEFDICDSQMCQAYYGKQTETIETDETLKNTEGLVLLDDDTIALTLYSSSHGGVSENYSNAFSDPKTQQFPAPPINYMISVRDDETSKLRYPNLKDEATLLAYLKDASLFSYDKKSPHFRWKAVLDFNTLSAQMPANLKDLLARPENARWIETTGTVRSSLGKITQLQPLERGESGKLMRLKVHTSTGSITATKELTIRRLLKYNGNSFKSATMAFEPTPTGVVVYGTGFGHGVGMSQYGASGMHDANIPFYDILDHYYPNTQLGSVPLTLDAQAPQEQHVHGVPQRKAYLHVKPQNTNRLTEPLIVQLNGQSFRLPPFEGSAHRLYDVSAFVLPDKVNTLVWPSSPSDGRYTVWLGFHKAS